MSSAVSLRFKVDNNLPVEVAERLRLAGHAADTAGEEGLAAADDVEIATACLRESRAILSSDTDFPDIRAYPPDQYPGIVVLRLRRQSKPRVLSAIDRLLPLLASERLPGALWIVDETSVRIRSG